PLGQIKRTMSLGNVRALQPAKPPQRVVINERCFNRTEIKAVPVIISPVNLRGETELAQVALAHRAPGRRLTPRQGGQQQRGQDRNNGDDHEQLNQRKSTAPKVESRKPRAERKTLNPEP